ncbi:uncharacterized protein LOC105277349 [Ooceraea biroi]|uniref:uncharacterized protein LOC105277349 n=1 Tax=Ooceraea biroi TaxID=2015173 RepID=UPI000F086EA5|nr:uncharacterized protein LOC105277349 [Ooceraea biroi]
MKNICFKIFITSILSVSVMVPVYKIIASFTHPSRLPQEQYIFHRNNRHNKNKTDNETLEDDVTREKVKPYFTEAAIIIGGGTLILTVFMMAIIWIYERWNTPPPQVIEQYELRQAQHFQQEHRRQQPQRRQNRVNWARTLGQQFELY